MQYLLCPFLGSRPIGQIAAQEVLAAVRCIEARGRPETAHRAKWKAGQVFRYAISTGRAKRDPAVLPLTCAVHWRLALQLIAVPLRIGNEWVSRCGPLTPSTARAIPNSG